MSMQRLPILDSRNPGLILKGAEEPLSAEIQNIGVAGNEHGWAHP